MLFRNSNNIWGFLNLVTKWASYGITIFFLFISFQNNVRNEEGSQLNICVF